MMQGLVQIQLFILYSYISKWLCQMSKCFKKESLAGGELHVLDIESANAYFYDQ